MDLKSIHEIFSNRILRIPSYQRGYSWSNNCEASLTKPEDNRKINGQLMDLWNDIINIPVGRWHYTGLLTLVESKNPKYNWLPNHKQYEIVDGQQRITSILILISVMVEQAKELDLELGVRDGEVIFQYLHYQKQGESAYIFGYDHDNPSDKFFRKHVLELDLIEDDSKESIYTENLRKAKAFFRCMVAQFISSEKEELPSLNSRKGKLQELFNCVTGSLRLNEYILHPELDEYVVFETMNNRGKPLSELEKLKNRLMYLGDKLGDTNNQDDTSPELLAARKRNLENSINKGWITIYQALGSNKEAPLDDEDFIRNHWIAYFDHYDKSHYAEHLFKDHFTIQRVYSQDLIPNDIEVYVKSLQTSSRIWNQIHYPQFFDPDETAKETAVRGLHRVGYRTFFKPLTLAALSRHDTTAEQLTHLFKLLEGYAFKVFNIAHRQNNIGDSKIYRLAFKVHSGSVSIEEACDHLQRYIDEYYHFSRFSNKIQELFDWGNKEGFYKWSGRHYFLFEYDHSLRQANSTSTGASKINWEDFVSKNTIEHIYPQSAAKSLEEFSDWNVTDKKSAAYARLQADWSAFTDYTHEERKRFCNSLGNLLALSNSDNASLGNDSFAHKVDKAHKGESYKNRGYRYDSMSAQIVAKETEWTPQTVLNRGLHMLDSMLSMLDEESSLLTKNEKIKLLGLEFMIKGNLEEETTV